MHPPPQRHQRRSLGGLVHPELDPSSVSVGDGPLHHGDLGTRRARSNHRGALGDRLHQHRPRDSAVLADPHVEAPEVRPQVDEHERAAPGEVGFQSRAQLWKGDRVRPSARTPRDPTPDARPRRGGVRGLGVQLHGQPSPPGFLPSSSPTCMACGGTTLACDGGIGNSQTIDRALRRSAVPRGCVRDRVDDRGRGDPESVYGPEPQYYNPAEDREETAHE